MILIILGEFFTICPNTYYKIKYSIVHTIPFVPDKYLCHRVHH